MEFKKSAHSSMDGERNEVRMAALLFLRCKRRSATISKFQLATNAAVGGQKLDDVVLRYMTWEELDVWWAFFVQLKKKDSRTLTDTALTGDSGDFSLKKLLPSFRHVKSAIQDVQGEELVNGSLDHCRFILSTTARAEGRLMERTENQPLGEIETLLEFPGATVHGFEEERDAVIFDALRDKPDGAEFLKKMTVIAGQPTPAQLETLIKQELRLRGDVTDGYVDVLYGYFEKRCEECWEGNVILDEGSDLYDLALADVRSHRVDTLSSDEQRRSCFDVRFQDLTPLADDFVDTLALLHLIVSDLALKVTSTRLLQLVRQLHPESFLFFSLKCLRQEMGSVLPIWRSNGGLRWLVVVGMSEDEDHNKLAEEICDVLQENKDKRIVVVSRKNDDFAVCLKKKLFGAYKEIKDDCRVSQMEEGDRDKVIVMSASFQGCEVNLGSILGRDRGLLEEIALDDGAVKTLADRRVAPIGRPLLCDVGCYIQRTLLNYAVLRDDVLRDRREELAVSGFTPDELQAAVSVGEGRRVVPLDSGRAETEWRGLEGAAHWIHKEGGQLVLRESRGCVNEMRPHVDSSRCWSYEVDDCFGLPQRTVCLVGEPGMGKTTLVTHLARQTKQARPFYWVVHVNLPEHEGLLKTSAGERPVEFLAAVLGVSESPFQTSLLRLSVERTGNVVVLLDGFDEIAPRCQSEGCRLVTRLLGTRVERIWVTARCFIKEAVERVTNTLAMQLQDFTEQNQVAFLARFWRDEIGWKDKSDGEMEDLIHRLLERVSESLRDSERSFMGIPLQTMMLAEVFSNYAGDPVKFSLPNKLDLTYLFENFVKKKFNIYVEKLFPGGNTNVEGSFLNDMRTCFRKKHMAAALVYLLPPDWLGRLDLNEEIVREATEFTEAVLSGEAKTGIVDGTAHGRLTFLHRCFAEFFVAGHLLETHRHNRDFLEKYIFSGPLRVVHEMFNRMLARDRPLHLAVLSDDVDLARRLLEQEQAEVDATDAGGRTALHFAACRNRRDVAGIEDIAFGVSRTRSFGPQPQLMIELLLEHGAKVGKVDSVLQWTPLRYAVGAESWEAADILLAAGSNPDQFVFPDEAWRYWYSVAGEGYVNLMKCIVDQSLYSGDDTGNCCVLQRSVFHGHIAIVRFLVTKSGDVLLPRLLGRTLLHQAARCGHGHVLDYLLEVLKRDAGCAEGINQLDHEGQTAVCLALEYGFLDVATVLLECGGDLRFVQENSDRVLLSAASRGDCDVFQFVVEKVCGDREAVKACCNLVDESGASVVLRAAMLCHSDLLRYLVANGGDATVRDGMGINALHAVIGYASLGDVEMLIASLGDDEDAVGRFVNASYRGGVTPLHCVTYLNVNARMTREMFVEQAKIAKLLVSRGADVQAVDENGGTPLHWAAGGFACLPVVEALVAAVGDEPESVRSYVLAVDIHGMTAEDRARDAATYAFLSSREERVLVADWLDRVLEENRLENTEDGRASRTTTSVPVEPTYRQRV